MDVGDMLDGSFRRADAMAAATRRTVAGGSAGGAAVLAGRVGLGGLYGKWASDRSSAIRQLDHIGGWVHAATRPIASRIAARPLRIARMLDAPAAPGTPVPAAAGFAAPLITKDSLPSHLKDFAPRLQAMPGSHALVRLLDRPNPTMVRWTMMAFTTLSLEFTGRAFWWVTRAKGGGLNLWPIPSSWMEADHTNGLYASWKMTPRNSGEQIDVPSEDIIYFSYPDAGDPLNSMSPLQMQSKAVASDEAIQDAQQRAFKNGIFPGVMVTVGQQADAAGNKQRPTLTKQQRADIVAAVKAQYRGILRYDEPVILDALIESVSKFTHTPREMDFLESGKQTKSRIFQGFGVNQFIAGELENVNRATAVVSDANFCDYVVNPKLELMSQIITAYLLPIVDKTPGLVAYFEEARPNDPEMRLKEAELLLKGGSLLRDELRAMFGIGPMPDGAGKTIVLMPGAAIVPTDYVGTAGHDGSASTGTNKPLDGGTGDGQAEGDGKSGGGSAAE